MLSPTVKPDGVNLTPEDTRCTAIGKALWGLNLMHRGRRFLTVRRHSSLFLWITGRSENLLFLGFYCCSYQNLHFQIKTAVIFFSFVFFYNSTNSTTQQCLRASLLRQLYALACGISPSCWVSKFFPLWRLHGKHPAVNKTQSDFMLTLTSCFIIHLRQTRPHISNIIVPPSTSSWWMTPSKALAVLLPATHRSFGGGGNDPDSSTAVTFENRVRWYQWTNESKERAAAHLAHRVRTDFTFVMNSK